MRIAFLGLGKMGSAIVRRLHQAGHRVVGWNRSAPARATLEAEGIATASTPAEAVQGAEAVFTMLMDDAAVEKVILADGGVLSLLPAGSIHVVFSTLSLSLSQKLEAAHRTQGQHFVAAPVFGRPNVAEAGKLWIVAGGEQEAVERIRPVLECFSRGITVLPSAPQAHALKLGGNFMIAALIQTLSEAFVYAESQQIDPALLLETVNDALFQSPFYSNYGNVMLHPPEQPGATIALGEKDVRLMRAAAPKAQLPLAKLLWQQLDKAQNAGLGTADWAAAIYQISRSETDN